MKLVPESLQEAVNFERGLNPKKSIGIGIWSKFPKKGELQEESFDLYNLSKEICRIYNLPIKNYTPIDEKSNYNWSDGYQAQFVTMNLNVDRTLLERFMGPEYMKKMTLLLGKDYVPPLGLGIKSKQIQWISKYDSGYEFDENSLYVFIKGGGYTLSVNFQEKEDVSKWIPDRIKDQIMEQVIWDLRYKGKILFSETIPQGAHMRDRNHIKMDVKKFVKEYGPKTLDEMMRKSYMWTTSVWNITNGILEFTD